MSVLEEIRWVRRHGIKAWLTWATLDEAVGGRLRPSARFWRRILG